MVITVSEMMQNDCS